MTKYKVLIEDEAGNVIYPRTIVGAISMDDGTTLQAKLDELSSLGGGGGSGEGGNVDLTNYVTKTELSSGLDLILNALA